MKKGPLLATLCGDGIAHLYGDDAAVSDLESQLVQNLWPMGFSNADTLQRLNALLAYIQPKVQAAQNAVDNFLIASGFPTYTTSYPDSIVADAEQNYFHSGNFSSAIPTAVASGLPGGSLITLQQLLDDLQDFWNRSQAIQDLMELYSQNNSGAISALNSAVHSPTAENFWEVSDLPLDPTILAPIVTVNPITGGGMALSDVTSIAATDPVLNTNTVILAPNTIANPTPGPVVSNLQQVSLLGLPLLTPTVATNPDMVAAQAQQKQSQLLTILALAVAAYALVVSGSKKK